jgi:exonuclease SbcC
LKRITFSEEEYSNNKKLRDECETRRDAAAAAHNVLSHEKQKIEYDVTTLKNELKRDGENRKKVEKNSKEMEVLNRLDWFFDDFRNVVLDRVKPAIAGHAGELFSRITAGRYEAINVDGDFGFFIQDEGRLYPIQRFSGGEVDCANLCLRIAISRTISDLAGSGSIGFLGFDEIFGSQDMDRRREIMDALLYLKEMYRQIFIISHIEEIKEEFPQVLHVTRTAAGSKVQWLHATGQ